VVDGIEPLSTLTGLPVINLGCDGNHIYMVALSAIIVPTKGQNQPSQTARRSPFFPVQGADRLATGTASELLFLVSLLVGVKEEGYEGRCRSDSEICVSQLKSLCLTFWAVTGSIKIAEFCYALNDNNQTT
jgi:hypothetical protein